MNDSILKEAVNQYVKENPEVQKKVDELLKKHHFDKTTHLDKIRIKTSIYNRLPYNRAEFIESAILEKLNKEEIQ